MNLKYILTLSLVLSTSNLLAAEHTVEMKHSGAEGSMVFEPSVLKVDVGDIVNFIPTDAMHNSESVAGLIPKGAKSWQGPLSEKVSVTIDTEGVYVYQCTPHSVMAMVGVIVAGEATNLEEVKEASKELSASFIMGQGRLKKYLADVEKISSEKTKTDTTENDDSSEKS